MVHPACCLNLNHVSPLGWFTLPTGLLLALDLILTCVAPNAPNALRVHQYNVKQERGLVDCPFKHGCGARKTYHP